MKTLQTLACAALLAAAAGAHAADYRSFGVVDFNDTNLPFFAAPFGSVGSALTFSTSDTTFGPTTAGQVNFYFGDGTVDPTTLTYNPTDQSATAGVGSQLGSLIPIGSIQYAPAPILPQTDTYNFTLSSAAQSYLLNALNTSGDIRLVMTGDPSTPNLVASFTGSSGGGGGFNGTPQITFTEDSVPDTLFSRPVLLPVPGSDNPDGTSYEYNTTGINSNSPSYLDIEGIGNVTPAPTVPEANTSVLLLGGLLGFAGLGVARRRKAA